MTELAQYSGKYRNIKFNREDGILQITLHTDGGVLTWGAVKGSVHGQLPDAFYDVGMDPENEVVILTGTGDVFCNALNFAELPMSAKQDEWYDTAREGRQLLMNLLDIDVPVIGVANGPATFHAELLTLSDIVIAAEHATFADAAHFAFGAVPGDGVHVVWPMLLGPNRGRYFLMMDEVISAAEAKQIGFVGEVLAADKLLPRAWEIARHLLTKPSRMRRYTRALLTQRLKVRLMEELTLGLAYEGHGLGFTG